MSPELAFYAVAVPAVLIVGLSKGAFGVSMGILATPLLALAMPIREAVAIMLPILVAMDCLGAWAYRRTWDGRNLALMLPGAAVGLVLGTLTFQAVPEHVVRLLLGLIAVSFTVHYWLRGWAARASGIPAPPRRPPAWVGLLAGTVSGFTSFVAHAGGPPASVYLLPQRLEKSTLTGTTVMYFTVVNVAKLPAYAGLELLGRASLTASLLLAPLAVGGVWVGVLLHRRLSAAVFYRIAYGLVFVSGVKLLYDAAGALLAGG